MFFIRWRFGQVTITALPKARLFIAHSVSSKLLPLVPHEAIKNTAVSLIRPRILPLIVVGNPGLQIGQHGVLRGLGGVFVRFPRAAAVVRKPRKVPLKEALVKQKRGVGSF
jgi:hypothetical protein